MGSEKEIEAMKSYDTRPLFKLRVSRVRRDFTGKKVQFNDSGDHDACYREFRHQNNSVKSIERMEHDVGLQTTDAVTDSSTQTAWNRKSIKSSSIHLWILIWSLKRRKSFWQAPKWRIL
eukprot:TRINITY_DN11157_c0_g1_i1.p1 TRINITY_DN11157_c0_g1~~TRINITY_DN11157_c0_g1_i1.p1  ORF type:complete len:135 (+),score=25.39 TRINITY_DN11157_c0_g1_i1:50-406(+)